MKYQKGQHPNSHKHLEQYPWMRRAWGTHPNSWKRSLENGFVPGVRKPPADL